MVIDKLSVFKTVNAADINKIIDEVNRFNNIAVSPPLEVSRSFGGLQIRYTELGFTAAIVGSSNSSVSSHSSVSSASSSSSVSSVSTHVYTAVEVCPNPSVPGDWIFLPGGRELENCVYEWNHQSVPSGTIVWVEPFGHLDWRFEYASFNNNSTTTSSISSLTTITKAVVVDVVMSGCVISPVYENICVVVCPSSSSSSSS